MELLKLLTTVFQSSLVMAVVFTSYMSENDASTIVIDDSRVMLQIVVSLTVDSRTLDSFRSQYIYTEDHRCLC